MDDDRLYSRLLQLFLRQNQDFAAAFRASLTIGDIATARRLAHDLSSGAGAIGAVDVQRAASELEAACASGAEMHRLRELLQAAVRALSPVMDGLRGLLPDNG